MSELTKEQELRKTYLFFKPRLTPDEELELRELMTETPQNPPSED